MPVPDSFPDIPLMPIAFPHPIPEGVQKGVPFLSAVESSGRSVYVVVFPGFLSPRRHKGSHVSQTTKTILLRALITTAGLWIFAMTAAMGYVTFRI
jgi:hypothetical protein